MKKNTTKKTVKKPTGRGGPGRGQGRFSPHEGGTKLLPIRVPVKQLETVKDLNPQSVGGFYVTAMEYYLLYLENTKSSTDNLSSQKRS